MSKTLAELLGEADASAPPPPSPTRLAETIRTRSRCHAARRRVIAAVALPVALGAASAWVLQTNAPAPHPTAARLPSTSPSLPATALAAPVGRAALLADRERLEAEAALRLSIADGLRSLDEKRRRAARARDLASGNAGDTLDAVRERAALTLLDHGDRLRQDLKQVDAALAAYRKTIELFPDTRWAGVAKRRIETLLPDARGDAAPDSLT